MTRSRLSYAEAVRLLLGGDDPVTILGRAAGGAMLIAAPFAEGVLSWFDYKGEANNLLRELLGRAPARIRASRGRRHYELLEAAHTVLVLSAFFDALTEHIGDRLTHLELTDDERARIGGDHIAVTMPGAVTGFAENLPAVERAFQAMHTTFRDFAGGLAAAEGMTMPAAGAVVTVAAQIYRERYVRLAADVPEFAFWSQLDEFAATRAEVRRQTETLTGVAGMLARITDVTAPAAVAGLTRHYARVLEMPLWRSDTPAPDGLTFPLVKQGFISPRFRLAVSGRTSALGDESWWREHEVREDLDEFLSGFLTAPDSTQRPLIILGHPGAGKSLLTEVLAARVPTESFTTIRVPLRRADPAMPIHDQIVTAVEMVTRERLSWGELCRGADTTKVVLLDGFDELVQATGVTQSHYVEQVAAFQQQEWVQERPVIVVITSRTLVMDRTVVRDGTLVAKLEPFDEPRVERWTTAWNAANHDRPDFRPLTSTELWRHADLAGQPLLLLMLAVYAAEAGRGGLDADLSTDQLYRRLLDSFIHRQIREKAGADLGDSRFRRLEADSRRDLAAVAFAMFNRRRQWVSEEALSRDLEALHPEKEPAEPGIGEPVSRARRTVSAFFFVHVAKTEDEVRVPGRRSYEFLHATFGEYLIAEQALELLTELADDWQRAKRRSYQPGLDDRVLRALLSHQPLSNGERILPFLIEMIGSRPDVEELLEVLLELFQNARRRIIDDTYCPTPFDVVNRMAAYTANLVLLATVCRADEGVSVYELGGDDGSQFNSTVRLWRSGLDDEAQESLFSWISRDGWTLVIERGGNDHAAVLSEALLVGDVVTGVALSAGWETMGEDVEPTAELPVGDPAFQRKFHLLVVNLLASTWPAAGLTRLTLFDERRYVELADFLDRLDCPVPLAGSVNILGQCLFRDGSHIATETLDRLLARYEHGWYGSHMEPEIPLALLALTRPLVISRNPWLGDLVLNAGQPVFLYEVARACRNRNPRQLDPIIEELRDQVNDAEANSDSLDVATASMIVSLRSYPNLLWEVLKEMHDYGDVAWSQISPHDLLAACGPAETWDETTALIVADYAAVREHDCFEGDDAKAFAVIREATEGLPAH